MTLLEVHPDTEVFRLVSHTDEHFPPDAPKPHPVAFALTTEDRAEAAARGLPSPLLSVFDIAKTSIDQGRAIRAAQAAAASRLPKQTTAFAWRASALTAFTLQDNKPRLTVLHDPLDPKWGPGSEGHAGISGLDGYAGEVQRKDKCRLMRSKLVDLCYRI